MAVMDLGVDPGEDTAGVDHGEDGDATMVVGAAGAGVVGAATSGGDCYDN